jgi:hypothetical protein
MRFFAASLVLLSSLTAYAQVQRPLPVVERLEPTSGPPGSTVIVVGRHFDPQQTLWIGEVELEIVSRLPNRWTVRVPASAESGTLDVRLARGTVNGPRFRVSQALPSPVVSSFTPARGAPGTEVILRGENFSTRITENHVHLGELPVVVRNATPTELTVIVPNGAVSGPFRVSVTGAGETASSTTFEVGTGTSVASFAPLLGPPGSRVVITGTGFSRNRAHDRVYIGDVRARVIRASETELEVEVPRRGVTDGLFLVDVQRGGRAYSATEFRVRSLPVITAVDPAAGAPGTRVTITGQNFGTDVREVEARIGAAALVVRDLANERMVVEIPEGASTGPIEVTVAGLGPARTRAPVAVLGRVVITSFLPVSGPPGTVVRITGTGFSTVASNNVVSISGQAAELVRASATELEVRIPAGVASGPFVVAVANAGEARMPQPFVITRTPTIEAFTPTEGPPGTTLTIRGANFGTVRGLVDVRIGELRAEVLNLSDTQIEVRVPNGIRTGPIRVTVRLQGTVTSAAPFTGTAQ